MKPPGMSLINPALTNPLINADSNRNHELLEQWLSSTLITNPSVGLHEKVAITFGLLVGAFSSYVFYPLGYGFGVKVSSLFHLEKSSTAELFPIFFGITSIIPMISLGCSSSQKIFRHYLNKTEKNKGIIMENEPIALKMASMLIVHWLSGFAGLQRAYLSAASIPRQQQALSVVLAIFGFSGAYLSYVRVYDSYRITFIKDCIDRKDTQCMNMLAQLKVALQRIDKCSDDDVQELYSLVFGIDQIDPFERLKSFITYHQAQEQPLCSSNPGFVEKNFPRLGIALGFVGAYAYYNVGVNISVGMVNFPEIGEINYDTGAFVFDHPRQPSDEFKVCMGLMTALPIALMYGITSYSGFKKFYAKLCKPRGHDVHDFTTSRFPKLKKAVDFFAAAEGILAAIPALYLMLVALDTINHTDKASHIAFSTFMASSAFITHIAFTFYAVRTLFLDLFDSLVDSSNNIKLIGSQKDQLRNFGTTLFNGVGRMSPDIRAVLDEKSFPNLQPD